MGSKGSATTTTNTSANPAAASQYYNLLNQAQTVASTPYTPYTGELTAPVNTQQQSGISGINQYAQTAQPYLQTAAGLATSAAQPLTTAQIQQYQSPYTQDVVNSTQAEFNNQNAQQQQGVLSNAAAQGALGGDRVSVAQGITAGQQQLAQAPVIAGLENQGYTTGLQTAEQQQQNQAQGAYNLSNVGTSIENAGLTGANAQVGAGSLEQQTQQAQDTAAYQQFEQALQYPFATTQWEAGIDTGVGSQLGGSSSTTAPAPNYLAQDIGAGLSAGALLFSDRRSKDNIKRIGKLYDGQTIYRFNYKGDPTTRIGLMAQDVEKVNPDAVHEVGGRKAVDYAAATKDAIRRFNGGRIQGLDSGGAASGLGGAPYGGGTPYGGAQGWVPTLSISPGSGAPKPPGVQNQNQQNGVQSASQMMASASKIAPSLSSGLNNMFGQSATYGGGNILSGDVSGGTAQDPLAGLDASDYGAGSAGSFVFDEAAGGRVPRAYGGLAIPRHNAIRLNRGGVPVRAGFGMASFLPRRQGLDTGGVPDDADATFADRFSGLVPDAPQGWAAALSPVSPAAAAYGQDNPYATAPNSAPAPMPPNQNVPGPTSGLGDAVSYGTPAQGAFPPVAVPPASPSTPVPPLQVAPTANAGPSGGLAAAAQPPADPMDVYQHTIQNMETGGEKNPYGSTTPSVDPKTGTKRYALGAYGIMDSNVPSWTKEALGHAMTPQQFLADPSAQDAVFRAKFGQYTQKYGPEGAARAWLAGEGGMNNPNVRDEFGTDPISYGRKFANGIVGQPMASGAGGNDNAQLPANATPTAGHNAQQIAGLEQATTAQPEQRGFGLLGLLPQDIGMSTLSAGAGMLASRSPYLGVGLGEGLQSGMSQYGALQQQHLAQQKQQQDVDLKVRQLNQQAKSEQDRLAQEAKTENDKYTQMTPAEKAEIDFRNRQQQITQLQPVKIGTDMATGAEIYGVRDPSAPGGFRRIDASSLPGANPAGGPAQPGAQSPTSGTPNAQAAAASLAPTPDSPKGVKPEVLSSIDPTIAAQVKALDEGRMQFPSGFALKSPYWQNMLRLTAEYDPSFDAVNYNARSKVRSDFVAGKSAQNITSFNTAIGHLDNLDKAIDTLPNTRFGWLNPLIQDYKSATGDTQYQEAQKNFATAKQAVTDELTRAFRGSSGNVHDIEEWEKTLNQADSPAALHAAVKSAVSLLNSRVEAVGDQYNRGMGTTRDPLTLLSPHAQATVARLSGNAPQQQNTQQSTNAAPVLGAKLYQGKWYTRGANGEAVPVSAGGP